MGLFNWLRFKKDLARKAGSVGAMIKRPDPWIISQRQSDTPRHSTFPHRTYRIDSEEGKEAPCLSHSDTGRKAQPA